MMKPSQYIKANGYSNMFWGWGREDSDMEYRLSRGEINPIKDCKSVDASATNIEGPFCSNLTVESKLI